MATQFYGDWTKLDPPVTVGLKQYSLGIRLRDCWANRDEPLEIVSGIIESVTTLSGDRKKIVCRRDWQSSSKTVVYGPGDSVEVEIRSMCGGNICETEERRRVYSYLNGGGTSYRGNDRGRRATAGDLLEIEHGAGVRRFRITRAESYAEAPGSVDWTGGAAAPVVSRFQNLPYEIRLEPAGQGDAVVFTPGAAGVFGDCGITLDGAGLTRKLWQAGGVDDGDYLPQDAALANDEYWFSPGEYAFRFSSYGWEVGTALVIVYWRRGLTSKTSGSTAQQMVAESSGAMVYNGTQDSVGGAGKITSGDFMQVVKVESGSGAGALEWRRQYSRGGQVAALAWSALGEIEGVYYRATDGGTLASAGITGGSYTFPFYAKITQSGDSFTLSHSQDGAAWTDEGPVTLTGVGQYDDGILSVISGAAAVKFSDATGVFYPVGLGRTGTLSARETLSRTLTAFVGARTLPVATAITGVMNETTGEAMETGTSARNVYSEYEGVVYISGEACGDWIKVTQAAAGSAPTPPGDAPVVSSLQQKFADGGTDVNANRANWFDVVEIHDPDSEFLGVAGDVFTVVRGGGFSTQAPPDVSGAARNGADWEALGSGDYVARWAENLVLGGEIP